MSIINKYLKQTCKLQRVLRDSDGKALLDMYGSPQLQPIQEVTCRKELSTAEVLTSTGSIIKSEYVYYLDVEAHMEDRLDGKAIVSVSELVNPRGKAVGYQCRT